MTDAERAQQALAEVLKKMGVEADVLVFDEEESIVLEVRGEETALVIGRQGQTLDSLQLIIGKMVYGAGQNGRGKPIIVDAEGYRDRREQTLVDMARRLAEKALRSRRRVALQPMSAHDRRVVHMALSEVPGVTTRSEGEGLGRRLMIIPE